MTYQNILDRLKQERLRHQWSQMRMGQCMRMSQSHYSKAELGIRRLTYYELQFLCESEIDVHFIFTGYKNETKGYDIFQGCSYAELIFFLSILYSTYEYFYSDKISHEDDRYQRIDYIKFVVLSEDAARNILYDIRRYNGFTQSKMAEILEVDIKKLRDLENGSRLPDSELLFRIYLMFHLPPAVILKDRKGLASEVCSLMGVLDEQQRDHALQYLEACHNTFSNTIS